MDDKKKFSINVKGSVPNKVETIKALRSLTGLGLKEAKDAVETYGNQVFEIPGTMMVSQNERYMEEQFRILRNNGVEVGSPVYKLLDELRELGSQALLQGEDELANEILQLVLAEKLRRKFA